MPVLVMMGPGEFKMLSAEPRDRVIQGTMDDYDQALAEGLITPYQGRALRFPQPEQGQAAQPAQVVQAGWRGTPAPAQTYSAPASRPAPAAYQPAPNRGSVGMQIVSAGQPATMPASPMRVVQPVSGEPERMQSPPRPPAFNTQSLPPMSYDNTILTNPAQEQMQAWRPAPYGANGIDTQGSMPAPVPEPLYRVGPKINPVTGFPYQREDLPQPDASYNSMALAQPMPDYSAWRNSQPVSAYGAYAPNTEGTPPLFYTPANVNPVTGLPYQRSDSWR